MIYSGITTRDSTISPLSPVGLISLSGIFSGYSPNNVWSGIVTSANAAPSASLRSTCWTDCSPERSSEPVTSTVSYPSASTFTVYSEYGWFTFGSRLYSSGGVARSSVSVLPSPSVISSSITFCGSPVYETVTRAPETGRAWILAFTRISSRPLSVISCCIRKFFIKKPHILHSFYGMQNRRLCCFSFFDLQDPLDVVDHDVDHQRHQKHQAREVNHTLQVSPDWFSADGFYDQKDKPSAVECRERQQVHDAKVR